MTVHAVLLPIVQVKDQSPGDRMGAQRVAAREALRICASISGAPEHGWCQDERGVPLPLEGFHWSISHKRRLAAAVAAKVSVGVDVEEVKPRRNRLLFDEVGCEREWNLLGERSWPGFFELWTAKEATLKANGVGIGKLAECRVVERLGEGRLVTEYAGGGLWQVERIEHDGHVAAVALPHDGGCNVEWHVG